VTAPGYLRFPHIAGDFVAFVAADDVWLATVTGGRAWRFTADEGPCLTPRFSADGTRLAWASGKDGGHEIYQASVADGTSTRLTYWGAPSARVCCWTPDGEVVAVCAAGQPFPQYPWARAIAADPAGGQAPERLLPFGPVADLSVAPVSGGVSRVALLTGTFGLDPAHWKRYRGGTSGRLWIGPADAVLADRAAAPGQRFRRVLADLPGQFACPMLVGGRFAFISDHEGTGNIYSCAPDGSDLRRHTDLDGWYAR